MRTAIMESVAPLTGRLVARERLSSGQVDAMRRLMDEHFEGITREVFETDLQEKNWAILLEDPEGHIRGFSTLLFYRTRSLEETLSVIYSGDTIVGREHWGSAVLPRTWIRSVKRLAREHPEDRVFWILISSGFRTYRFLPLFWKVFHPRCDLPMPSDAKRRLDALAIERFGEAYDSARGVVRFEHPQILCDGLRDIPPGRMEDPHVAFFAAQNPGYVRGDEIVCLTEIAESNLTPAGRRMWGRTQDGLG